MTKPRTIALKVRLDSRGTATTRRIPVSVAMEMYERLREGTTNPLIDYPSTNPQLVKELSQLPHPALQELAELMQRRDFGSRIPRFARYHWQELVKGLASGELKLCPNPECGQPFSGPSLTCSFHCATAYVGFSEMQSELGSAAEGMFLTRSDTYACQAPTSTVTLRLVPPPQPVEAAPSFNPATWAASNLDLLRPPSDEDYPKLAALTITQLKELYQMLLREYAFEDWPDFVWDVLATQLQHEITVLLERAVPALAPSKVGAAMKELKQ